MNLMLRLVPFRDPLFFQRAASKGIKCLVSALAEVFVLVCIPPHASFFLVLFFQARLHQQIPISRLCNQHMVSAPLCSCSGASASRAGHKKPDARQVAGRDTSKHLPVHIWPCPDSSDLAPFPSLRRSRLLTRRFRSATFTIRHPQCAGQLLSTPAANLPASAG